MNQLTEHPGVDPADRRLRDLQRQTDLLSRFAAELIQVPGDNADGVLEKALREMGELVRADRVYIFHYDFAAGITRNTHEWCAPGIEPQIDRLQACPLADIPAWVQTHRRGESLIVEDVGALPPGPLRDILQPQGIQSLISLPLMGSQGCYGFVGFDAVRARRDYGPEALEILGLFAKILAGHEERLRAERQLAESEANFHAFFDQSQDFLFVLDQQGNIIHCNRYVTQRLGFSMEELLGVSVLQVHPAERRDEAARIVAAMLEGKADHCPIPLQTRSGRLVPVETRVVAGQWNGAPALFGVSRDMSRIAASEEKFSKAFHLSPVAMAISDMEEGIFLEVNAAFSRITGYPPEEAVGSTSKALGLLSDPGQRERIVAELQRQEQVTGVEVNLRHKSGERVCGLFHAALLELQNRRVMITQMMDITARQQAERAVIEGHQQFQAVLSGTSDGFWLVDTTGRLIEVNEAYCRYSGYAREEMIGMPVSALDAVDDQARILQRGDQVIAHGSLVFESRHRRKDGSLWPVEIAISFMPAQEGRFFVFIRNIEERKAAEQERLRMERELQQTRKMEALGQLTGGVAHEFNNMLAIMLGHAGLLRARLGSAADPRLAGYLNHIEQAGSRARDLIRQMSVFSRPQENRPERIALKPAVQEAITLARASLPSSIEIDYHSAAGLPDVRLDLGELQQLLTNLMINARDAMDGKGRIEVEVGLYRDEGVECRHCHSRILGEWVQIGVSDNGHGISREQLPRIFEPFYSTKAVGKGTGLGLAVVLGIVDRGGGHILVDSEPGSGSRFRLLFPAFTRKADALLEADEPIPQDGPLTGRVLVVDDEPAIVEMLWEILRQRGLEVQVSSDSRQALSLLLAQGAQFDLLISDQTMPGLLGTELVRQAKARLPGLKVLLCTGHSDRVDSRNAGALGIDRYLLKPVDPAVLWAAVEQLIGATDGAPGP